MRIIRSSEVRRMPWRNGGGTTREIVVAPEGADARERFLYRVSIADVVSDGPFSRFDGYDRTIMLLEGKGMTIDCGAHGTIDLSRPFEPRPFSGDWDVRGTLVDGAVRDFNVIVDRARASASVVVRDVASRERIDAGVDDVCVVHVIAGALSVASAGDSLVADAPFDLEPIGKAKLVLVRVELRR